MSGDPIRHGASRVLLVALAALLAAGAVQVALAGAPAFGAPGRAVHTMLGGLVAALAAITLVVALVARPGRELLAASAAILVLAGLQPLFAALAHGADPWFGLLHAADALFLFALSAWAAGASRVNGSLVRPTISSAS